MSSFTQKLSLDYIKQFNVVVLTESREEELRSVGGFCHENKIKFIVAQTVGLFGMIFNDFGEGFVVNDHNGEDPLSAMIASVTKGEKGEVTCLDETRHGFEDGDFITFKEVDGMSELNGKEFQIEVTG